MLGRTACSTVQQTAHSDPRVADIDKVDITGDSAASNPSSTPLHTDRIVTMRSPSECSLSDSDEKSASAHTSASLDNELAARDEQLCPARSRFDVTCSRSRPLLIKRFTETPQSIASSEVPFTARNYIGEGSISFVFKSQLGGRDVAVKVLRMDTEEFDADGMPLYAQDFAHELGIASMMLDHPSVLAFVGAGTTVLCNAEVPIIVYEYMNGGSVEQLLEQKKKNNGALWKPPSKISLSWCKQLLEALSYLHNFQTPLAHRDIKPANVLVSKDMRTLKLADFSLAKQISQQSQLHDFAGSLRYMAPEVSMHRMYDLEKADVFSAALTCWSMIHGQRPFCDLAAETARRLMAQSLRPAVKNDDVGAILTAAWHASPHERPSAHQMQMQLAAVEQKRERGWGTKVLAKVRTSFSRISSSPRSMADCGC